MRLIIGLILFWFSTFGYLFFFKKKTKLPYEFLLPFIFTLVGIIIFVSGVLNMMKEFCILLCFVGLILFGYNLIKKNIDFKKILNVKFIVLFLAFLYITIVCGQMNLLHYDNFSHWGLIIKNMFVDNHLPNFENAVIEFRNYQPGSACFIYYFAFLAGKSEASMIIAQNYLLLSYLFSLLVFISSKFKRKYFAILLLISIFAFMLCGNIMFNDLLVDSLIAVMLIYSFAILYYFKDDLKSAFIYNLPVVIFLFLVKNIGIILVCFSCVGLLYIGYRNKMFKKGFIYALLSGIITVLFFYIWTKHVAYAFGNLSLYSKHSLTTENMISELQMKGFDRIFEFCGIYLKHFIDILNNIPNLYMIGIDIIVILFIVLYKNRRKYFAFCLAIINIIYLLYYGILGLMYLLSMPWSEAVYLAGFDRYMLTIIFVIIGLVFIFFVNAIMEEKNVPKKTIVLSIFLICMFMFLTFKNAGDYKVFLGDVSYSESKAYKFDEILKADMFDAADDDFYYIYAPVSSNNDSGYLHYLSRYKLNSNNISIVKDISNFEELENDEFNEKIIVFDKDDEIMEYIDDNNYQKNGNIYVKEKEEQ